MSAKPNDPNTPVKRNYRISWIQGKRDPNKEAQVARWISSVTGEQPSSEQDLQLWLKDGTVLSNLINKLQPGSTAKVHLKGEFGQLENIANFLQAATRLYGLTNADVFETADLWEGTNMPKVTSTLLILAERTAAKTAPSALVANDVAKPKVADKKKK